MNQTPEFRTGVGGEGARWYLPNYPVQCVYEIRGKNGNFRPIRKTDARTYGLVPGVTGVIDQIAKPGLTRWLVRQGILSALTHPKAHEVTDIDELVSMIEKDSQEQVKQAAAKGTAIHKAIEGYFKDESVYLSEYRPYIDSVLDALYALTGVSAASVTGRWHTETAATHPLGYGGRVDLWSAGLGMVVDFKGKEFGPDWKPEAYPEQAMQLAAYENLVHPMYTFDSKGEACLQKRYRCVNLFISRNNPGLVKAYEWNPSDIEKAWREFKCLLEFWKIRNSMV